ncbi:MAG: nicotinamide phosphoribosyltransferase domain-containing protein [Rhizobium sp.]|nr:nicotinamide phosphoribosyltransferase domain-containing protein [Rhizobium sp.]
MPPKGASRTAFGQSRSRTSGFPARQHKAGFCPKNNHNPNQNTDSYKLGHYLQYPEATRAISSYNTTRGHSYKPDVKLFVLQMILK